MPTATKLACVSVVIYILVGAVDVALQGTVTQQDSPVSTAGAFALSAGLTILLLVLIAMRHNWARWIYVVLTSLSIPLVVPILMQEMQKDRVGAISTIVQAVLMVASVLLLVAPSSAAWFKGASEPAA
jgi:phosphatidylserine synthase